MEFNEKLQQLRKRKNLTQEELAKLLFVSRTAVSKWESGRGYPSIDSLKAVSKLFAVSIDELLSGDELISLAESDSREKTRGLLKLVFGILDCMTALMFFLPLFGQKNAAVIQSVSLLTLTSVTNYMRAAYICLTILPTAFGVIELVFCNRKGGAEVSLGLSIVGTMIFMLSRQPYAGVLFLSCLVLKGILLIKQQ